MKNIIKKIKEVYDVSEESIQELTKLMCSSQLLPKGHLLIKSGVVERNYYFIEKGFARSFTLIDGKESTSWFSREGDVTFSMLSSYCNEPGYEYVDLLEDSLIYPVPIKELHALYERNIEIANWSRLIHQKAFLDLELRHISLATQTAEERLNHFIEERGYIYNRINLGYIASYLGMSQVTLSRLRAKQTF